MMLLSVPFAAAAAVQTAPAAAPVAPTQACSGAEYRALDFWVGEWELSFEKADGTPGRAVNRITRDEFGSCVISERFEQADIGYTGASYSTYDKPLGQWVQTWVDNSGAYITLAGGPVEGKPYRFELKSLERRGPMKAWFRMIWEDVKADSLTWRWQQQQPDGSWKDSWVIRYQRRK